VTPSTIYVAGASSEAALVSSYMRRLEAVGWTVVGDWTAQVLAATVPDAELSEFDARSIAESCLGHAYRAGWFWFVAPLGGATTTGAWVELGARAYSDPRRAIYSGRRIGLFWSLAGHVLDTHDDALRLLGAS